MVSTPLVAQPRLDREQIIWLASVRPDGRPHLVPIWFVAHGGRIYFCIQPESVKARNIAHNPRVAMALENGMNPVVCEGAASPVAAPWPAAIAALFRQKYDWDITTDREYTMLVEVTVSKWLFGGEQAGPATFM